MDTQDELARKLIAGLDQASAKSTIATSAADAQALAELTARLQQQLSSLPEETRRLIHAADSGFAASGKWVADAIAAQDQQIKKLARATRMAATWLGSDGEKAERAFIMRGHIRGWAHRWRKEEKGTGLADSDPEFVAFASDCLTKAGVAGDHKAMIGKALGADWRTA